MKKTAAILFLFLTVILVSAKLSADSIPKIVDGTVDLTSFNFDQVANLNGNWQIKWNQIVNPEDFDKSKIDYQKVPMFWKNPKGYATYRLKIRVKPDNNILALNIPRILTAYKLFINGKLLISCGTVGKNKVESKGMTIPSVAYFSNTTHNIEIVIQISNYDGNRGGIASSFSLGRIQQTSKDRTNRFLIDAFLFGLILIMGCYHFILYYFHKKDITLLSFSIICLTISIRTIISGEYLLLRIISLSENDLYKLTYITYGLCAIATMVYFYQLFKNQFSRTFVKIFIIVISIFIALVSIIGEDLPVKILQIYHLLGIVEGLYIVLVLVKSVIRREKNALVIFIGSLVCLVLFISDILRSNQVIDLPSLTPVGLAIYIFMQSILIAKKFSNSFNHVEKLNDKLQFAMKEVERLSEEKIKHQAQLIQGISHNLKTPIMTISGTIERLIELINEYRMSISNKSVTIEDHYEIANDMKVRAEIIKPQCFYMSKVIDSVKKQAVKLSDNSSDEFSIGNIVNEINLLKNGWNCNINIDNKLSDNTKLKGSLISMMQIIINLIQNAIDAYGDQVGTIDICLLEENNKVLLKVSDKAGGIDKNIRDKMLKEMITTKGDRGAGLGLYMSYNTIRGYFGGDIWFESSDIGTTFYISIPQIRD